MSESTVLKVVKRESAGKGAARAVRREGLVPGVIYGDKKAPISIAISPRDLNKEIHKAGLWVRQFDLDLDGKKVHAMCHAIQFHPVTDVPLHVDFLRISKNSEVTVEVPVKFLNEEKCPGIKRGGVLNIVRRELELVCKASAIPEEIDIDLLKAEIGDSIKISSVKLPAGVVPTIKDRDFTIATIAAPTVMSESEDAPAEATEEKE